MKKAGSSRSKRTTKSTTAKKDTPESSFTSPSPSVGASGLAELQEFWGAAAEAGHRPLHDLTPEQRQWITQTQSNLISLLAHELRTPLTGVQNGVTLLEALLEDQLPRGFLDGAGDVKAALSQLDRNIRRMGETLAVLLDLAQFEAGKFKVEAEWMPVGRLVDRLRELQAAQASETMPPDLEGEFGEVRVDLPRFIQAVDRFFMLFEHGVGVPRFVLRWNASVREGEVIRLRLDFSPSASIDGLAEVRVRRFHEEWSAAHSAFEAGVFTSGSAFSGILLGEAEFLARPDGAPLGPEWAMVQAALKAHGGRFELRWEPRPAKMVAEFVLPARTKQAG